MASTVFQNTIAVLLLFFLASCGNKLEDLPKPDLKDIENDRAESVRFIFSKEGNITATLEGDEFLRNNIANPNFVDLKGNLKAEFFDDSAKVESTMTAAFGRYYPESGNIIVKDSVTVINRKGEKLETEELVWNQKIERFYTEKFVKITMDDQITYGDGLEANQDFTWIRIKNQRGSIPVNKGDIPFD